MWIIPGLGNLEGEIKASKGRSRSSQVLGFQENR